MVFVDPRHQDRVDLDGHARRLQRLDRRKLALQQKPRRSRAAVNRLMIANPRVNLLADLRIDGVHRNGHVAHLQLRQLLGIGLHVQPVTGHAQQHLGILLAHQPQGLHRFFGIGKRVARSGNAHHLQLRNALQHLIQVGQRLPGLQHRAGHPRAALIHAIEFAVAIVALDVALGRHGQMDPPRGVTDVRVETRMLSQVQCHGFTSYK